MKNLIRVFILFFVLSTQQVFAVLKLEVETSKVIHIFGEYVELGFNLENISNNEIEISYPNPATDKLDIVITNEHGEILPYIGVIGSSFGNKLKLKPQESYYDIFNINHMYGLRVPAEIYFRSLTKGKYTVTAAILFNGQKFVSNEISLEIVEPTGKDSIVFNRLTQLSDYNPQQFCSSLESMLLEYPNSLYAPTIISVLCAEYRFVLDNENRRSELVELFLDKYYYSFNTLGFIQEKLRSETQESRKEEFLLSMKNKTRNTIMERMIDKEIHQLNSSKIK